jgi:hypothetical protein
VSARIVYDDIFTREQYAAAFDAYAKRIKAELLERFDRGAEVYGILRLTSRDWVKEKHDEDLDSLAYELFDAERERRGL